jgi:hypothetical protein
MKWDVKIEEIVPQLITTPDAGAAPASSSAKNRPTPRLEDFHDD